MVERIYAITDRFLPHSRLVLALLCMVLTLMWAINASPLAVLPLSAALLLVWDVARNSAVWIGFRAFRQGNMPRVRRLLESVHWPQLLSMRSTAYYHWLKGAVEVADGRYEAARVHLLVAAAGQLRTENDRSLVQCLLAELALQQGHRQRAIDHLQLANALAHNANVAPVIQSLHRRIEDSASR